MNHFLLLGTFLTFVLVYLADVLAKSTMTENILLILPLAIVATTLALGLAIKELRTPNTATGLIGHRRAVGQIGLFLAFPLALPILKFDGATAVFGFASLVTLGERNLWRASLAAAAFGLCIAYLMDLALPIEVPRLSDMFHD